MQPVTPGPGQESVWDYPRPPACVASDRHVVVRLGETLIADTTAAYRVLETSHPPTWYLPRSSVVDGLLTPSRARSTFCEWKGDATYWDVLGHEGAMWSYEHPTPGFTAITGYVTCYPSAFECFVDDERVRPQEGGFYGGWITDDVVGPFKGGPGTWGW
ncbi:DUF427 domain-containing protein [uncultured Jatrophihabitans sp.]|uniref:DUF427 domain-containing protein n=1 Tax=uncultured Jatrophihabitans sp. TaxID=1610747 RepID=UPI0035CC0693